MTDDEMRSLVRKLAELNGLPVSDMVETVIEGREPEHLREAEEESEEEERGYVGTWRKGVWVTLGVVGLAFGLCIVFLIKWVNGAAVNTASTAMQQERQSIAPTPGVLPALNGLNIAFTYPKQFTHVSREQQGHGSGLESYTLDTVGEPSDRIAAEVENLPSGNLQDESGFTFRTVVKKADYQQIKTTMKGEAAVIMVKSDGSERTLYWAHKGKVVIISVTGSGDLSGFMNTVSTSLRWLS